MNSTELKDKDITLAVLADKKQITRRDYSHPAVYILQHIADDKMYIGSTQDLYARINSHRTSLEAGRHDNINLQETFNQNPNFLIGFIKVETKDQAMEVEQALINEHLPSSRLLNRAPDVYNSTKGMKLREETKEKLRQLTIKQFESEEARDVQRQISLQKWQDPDYKERHKKAMADMTPEKSKARLEKIGNTLREKFQSDAEYRNKMLEIRARRRRPVSIDGKIYLSMKEAVSETGITDQTIRNRLKNQSEEFSNYFYLNKEGNKDV